MKEGTGVHMVPKAHGAVERCWAGAGCCQQDIQRQRAQGREKCHEVPLRPGKPILGTATARPPAPAAVAVDIHLDFSTAVAQPPAFLAEALTPGRIFICLIQNSP